MQPCKPGEQIEVDWAGDPAHIIDPDTGEITDCWLFVGVLTYSQYTYVEAFMNERTGNWIRAHVHMFEFFGGVTPMLVADNCTTAVDHRKSDWYTPVLNTTYHEMAEHYNTGPRAPSQGQTERRGLRGQDIHMDHSRLTE